MLWLNYIHLRLLKVLGKSYYFFIPYDILESLMWNISGKWDESFSVNRKSNFLNNRLKKNRFLKYFAFSL